MGGIVHMNKNFEEPKVEVINIEEKDVITMSDPEMPPMPMDNV